MKYPLPAALLCWILTATACAARPGPAHPKLEGRWYVELDQKDIGSVRTVLQFETGGDRFEAWSRKGADRDLVGSWTSLLGRTFTKSFKEGSLLRLEQGLFRERGDTVRMAAILNSAAGRYNIEGYEAGGRISMRIRQGDTYLGSLRASRRPVTLPLEDYPALLQKAMALTEARIYNRSVLQTPAWTGAMDRLQSVIPKVQDDLEMVFAFFYYARKLPVSHYALLRMPEVPGPDTPAAAAKEQVFLDEKTPQTACLRVASFEGSADEMDRAFAAIRQKGYENLIIDLRDNAGGTVAAGMALATSIADSPYYGGIFLTQKYFRDHKDLPAVTDYPRFLHFTEANFDLILEGIHREEGLCLKVVPKADAFRGRVIVLTNGRTASTCEPIVYGLKQRRRATVVGEKTAGAMLNGEVFDLDKGFKLIVPTADYYTADGYRIDQKGVVPHVEVSSKDALAQALRLVR